jgi:precorrin-2 dehydrogenase/sirohydrochlorin ferrochelatase
MSNLYTISLNLVDKKCLVIGGGKVAYRKVISLLDAGAFVKVISDEFVESFKTVNNHPRLKLEKKCFSKSQIDKELFLVIAATNDKIVNNEIADLCNNNNILVNVIDNPKKSSFFVPAVLKRGDLTISISTNGKSPALSFKIKKELEKQYGEEYIKYINILGEIRKKVLANEQDPDKRKQIFHSLVESDILELVKLGEEGMIKERIDECLSL